MKDNESNVIMTVNRRLEDCYILIAECEAVREAILMAVNKDIPRVIIIVTLKWV